MGQKTFLAWRQSELLRMFGKLGLTHLLLGVTMAIASTSLGEASART